MSEDIKVIMQYIDEPDADPRTVEYMLNKGLVSSTVARDLKIVYHYRRTLNEVGQRGGAIYMVANRMNVTEMTVYRARRKFDRR